jgi:cobaltochelatase CobN
MSTTGDGLKSAENLLIYLATEYSNLSDITDGAGGSTGNSTSDNSSTGGSSIGSGDVKFLFILGTDVNTAALNTAAASADISSQLGITVVNKDQTVPQDFDFSGYSMIFIESQPETTIGNWNASINAAKANGAMVIGFNLSSNITLPNVDLYSANCTDIERYWVQGGETNMGNMLKFMGQKFSGAFAGQTLAEPEILKPKTNLPTSPIHTQTSII